MIKIKVLTVSVLITVFGYKGLCQLITSSPAIPESHPRLFITSSTLPEIKAKAKSPAFASEADRKSTRLNSSHSQQSRMPSSA